MQPRILYTRPPDDLTCVRFVVLAEETNREKEATPPVDEPVASATAPHPAVALPCPCDAKTPIGGSGVILRVARTVVVPVIEPLNLARTKPEPAGQRIKVVALIPYYRVEKNENWKTKAIFVIHFLEEYSSLYMSGYKLPTHHFVTNF